MDEIDRANAHAERMLDAQLAAQLNKGRAKGESRSHCAECGDIIPERRRQALPGVTLCAECASWAEHNNRRH